MPMYNKASLAKKPKATKKNRVAFEPLKKETTKKAPIERKKPLPKRGQRAARAMRK